MRQKGDQEGGVRAKAALKVSIVMGALPVVKDGARMQLVQLLQIQVSPLFAPHFTSESIR